MGEEKKLKTNVWPYFKLNFLISFFNQNLFSECLEIYRKIREILITHVSQATESPK